MLVLDGDERLDSCLLDSGASERGLSRESCGLDGGWTHKQRQELVVVESKVTWRQPERWARQMRWTSTSARVAVLQALSGEREGRQDGGDAIVIFVCRVRAELTVVLAESMQMRQTGKAQPIPEAWNDR